MSFPTTLSPWFVVARPRLLEQDGLEYYTTLDEQPGDPPKFSPLKREAMLIPHLGTAARIAGADPDCIIIALCSKEHIKEYGR